MSSTQTDTSRAPALNVTGGPQDNDTAIGAQPTTYRVYCFDKRRMIVTAEFITASSDEEAIALAQNGDYGSQCELWEGRRLVAQIGADAERRQA